jgi:hypothetical protein
MKKKADTPCEHINKVNQNIHGNTKGCEECEKNRFRLGTSTIMFDMLPCGML